MKQRLTLPLLFEARQTFFGSKIENNRQRHNVLKRMAFCNVFVNYAKKVDLAATIGKNHATVIHYNAQHEWHSKYCSEYIEYYNVANALADQYITEDQDFGDLDKANMISIIKELRHTIASKQAEVNLLNQELSELKQQIKDAADAKWNLKSYSAI